MRLCTTIRAEPAIAAVIGRVEPVDGVPGTVFAGWVSPESYADPDKAWTLEANAYDGSLLTDAVNAPADSGNYLELYPATSLLCSAIRFYLGAAAGDVNVDVHITGGAWINIASGENYDADEWNQVSFAAMTIDKARIVTNGFDGILLTEFEFGPVVDIVAEFSVAPRLGTEIELVKCS